MVEVSQCLADARQRLAGAAAEAGVHQATFAVGDRCFGISADHPGWIEWAAAHLAPLVEVADSPGPEQETYHATCLYSDRLLDETWTSLRSIRPRPVQVPWTPSTVSAPNARKALAWGDPSDMVIYLAPVLGIAWQVDARRRRLVVVVSSRTEWPALEHARALREMIVADLESRGWVRYHAGAVAAGDRGILVLGPPGSGKTTLIVSLLRLGGHYVANDRTLVSVTGRGVQARNFPLPAAVGVGTAARFPELRAYVSAAEALRFPQMRRDRHRPGSADDKIDFLPGELAGALGAPEPRRATAISCVVIPSVSQVARPIAVRPLPDGEKLDILTANCFAVTGDDVLRPWLPFGTLRSAPNVESLLALPCFEVSYHVDGCGDLVSTLAKSVDGRAGGGTG